MSQIIKLIQILVNRERSRIRPKTRQEQGAFAKDNGMRYLPTGVYQKKK